MILKANKITIIKSSYNIGVSRGWNYILKKFICPYYLILGDDNYFKPETLKIGDTELPSTMRKKITEYLGGKTRRARRQGRYGTVGSVRVASPHDADVSC